MILAVKNLGFSHHTSVVGDCAHIPSHTTILASVSASAQPHSLSSLCPFSLAHCNRLMFSHLRPIGALGADSSFLSFLVREGRPCYCDAEDIILIWLQQKATARRRRGDIPLATAAAAANEPPLQGSPTEWWYGDRAGRSAWQ